MLYSKPRSVAKDRIFNAALDHFVINGYAGASLNTIAEMVGIRKASIYAHFKSKDELFQELFADALSIECAFIQSCFEQESKELPGQRYCHALKERYSHSLHMRFLIRTAYVPPVHLYDYITLEYQRYIDCLTKFFIARLKAYPELTADQLTLYTNAYIGVVDSLHVDLQYSGIENFDPKLSAMLFLLEQGMQALNSKPQA